MNNNIALKIEHLNFKFNKNSAYFFTDLNLILETGKCYFLRGENGAGKSTLLRLLQGNIDPHEQVHGNIEIASHKASFNQLSPQTHMLLNTTISLVPQKFDDMLANQLSFTQNLQLANMSQYPDLTKLPAHKNIPDFIKRFNIDMNKPVHLLSGGQRQILAILMALQKNSSILLLDEPTAALDEQNAAMIMNFLTMLVTSQKLTVLIICHDKDLVTRYAQHGYFNLTLNKETDVRSLDFIV